LIPSILVLTFPGENPSFTRMNGALPTVIILSSIPIYLIIKNLEQLKSIYLSIIVGFILLNLAVLNVLFLYDWYFNEYNHKYIVNSVNSTEMLAEINSFLESGGTSDQVYIVAYPYWLDHRILGIEIESIYWNNSLVSPEQIENSINSNEKRIYILHQGDMEHINILQAAYPEGSLSLVHSKVNASKDFYVFTN